MDENTARVVLRDFTAHRATVADRMATKRWSWAAGVIRFPDSFCPLCGRAMRSNRIWVVDERAKRLLGVFKLAAGKLVAETPARHPHVNSQTSNVCMRDATEVYQALFIAWNLSSAYWQPGKSWFRDVFDHECGSAKVVGGLSAELKRSEAKQVVTEPVRPMAPNEVAPTVQPAVDDGPIFGVRQVAPTRRRPVRRHEDDDGPLFNGSMGGGISA